MVPTCAGFRAWEPRFAGTVLADNKTHIVSQNKCPELRRLNGMGSWELTGLTFPTESIPSLSAPLQPGSETWSWANPVYLTFRCDAPFLNIMILTLAVTFILSFSPDLPLYANVWYEKKQIADICSWKIWVSRGSEFKQRAWERVNPLMNKYGSWFSENSQQLGTLNKKQRQKYKYRRLFLKILRAFWANDLIQPPNIYLVNHFRCSVQPVMEAI